VLKRPQCGWAGQLDVVPHEDIESRRFEISSALVLLTLFAAARGPLDPAVIGAITSCAPDLEHILPLPRPGGRKLFPTHPGHGPHRRAGVPCSVQLLAAGVITTALIGRRPDRAYFRDAEKSRYERAMQRIQTGRSRKSEDRS
jgi:hypothetical protein